MSECATAVCSSACDQGEIAALLAKYCLVLDQGDTEAWIALFAPGATYDVYGQVFSGHAEIRRMISTAPEGLHLGGFPVIQIDGDHANAQQNLLFVDSTTGESRSVVYTDQLVRTDNGWRFAHRRCQFIVPDGLVDRPAR